MAHEVQDGVPAEPSVDWLRGECARLFGAASRVDEPDIAACAKLAELLFKMLPKAASEKTTLTQAETEAAKAAVLAARRQEALRPEA